MKKKISLLMLSILLLVGCAEYTNQPTKEKESETKVVKIESNKPKTKEEKKITVFKAYERGYGNFTDEAKEAIDQSFLMFNNTSQQVYKESLSLLIFKSFYDDIEKRLYVVGILYNNTENQIKNFHFDGILNFKINEKEFSAKSSFEFDKIFYPYIDSYEGVDIGIGFDVEEFDELLDPSIGYTLEDVQINLENIEFTIKK